MRTHSSSAKTRGRLSLAWLLPIVCATGCGNPAGSTSGAAPLGSAEGASVSSGAATATNNEVGSGTSAQSNDAKVMVDKWVEAQNKGDLAAYLSFYAKQFEGVKRSGLRTTRMDRKGWAADRGKMFERKMAVSADSVVVQPGAKTASITFTQTWESGSYKDVGPKLLVVVFEDNGWKITREEMVKSTVIGAQKPTPPEVTKFAFVIQDGEPQIVLDVAPKMAWAEGTPELLADAVPYPTRIGAKLDSLPEVYQKMAGRKMRLYGASGPVCEADLAKPTLLGRVIPHFGEVGRWHGTGDYQGQKPLSKKEIGRTAWDLAKGGTAISTGVNLVAALTNMKGDCKAGLWATAADEPVHVVAKAVDAPENLRQKALQALRKLPEYSTIQAESETKEPWDKKGKVEVSHLKHPSGTELLFISANAVEGCAGFQGIWRPFLKCRVER
ncbi:MAG: nuclear transport factor 2 family protein [Polyangiaceae bacterium]|nr:nuclear transport factor 2 family protein [Polyangiaceae bacterium]